MQKPPSDLPSSTGIYTFKKGENIIYIGKSVNIKVRISSHFKNALIDVKEKAIVTESDAIEYTLTDTEFNALLMESRLIQKYHPKYNSIWRDDKSYLYVKITITEAYPKLFFVRKENDGKSLYFGPFSSLQTIRDILKIIRNVYPYCTQKKITKTSCFYSKLNLCNPYRDWETRYRDWETS